MRFGRIMNQTIEEEAFKGGQQAFKDSQQAIDSLLEVDMPESQNGQPLEAMKRKGFADMQLDRFRLRFYVRGSSVHTERV